MIKLERQRKNLGKQIDITLYVDDKPQYIDRIPGDTKENLILAIQRQILNKYAQKLANRLLSQIGQPSQRFGQFARSVQRLPQEGYIPALTNKLGQLGRYVEYYPNRRTKKDFHTLMEVIKHYEEREPAHCLIKSQA